MVSELSHLIGQLDQQIDGPELFRMNDRANDLLRKLPLQTLGDQLVVKDSE